MIEIDLSEVNADRGDPLAELILYIAQQFRGDEPFGKTKLNKILFYSDFIRYGQTGDPITNQKYQRETWGPVNRGVPPVLEKLIEAGDLEISRETYLGQPQKRPVALRDPNLELFSGAQIELVDEVIEALRDVTATDVSALSHRFPGWRATPAGEIIPYETVFVSERELTEEEKSYAAELVGDDV